MTSIAMSLTLNADLPDEAELLGYLSQFKSGKGNQYRSFEIKRLLLLATRTESGVVQRQQAQVYQRLQGRDIPSALPLDAPLAPIAHQFELLTGPLPTEQQDPALPSSTLTTSNLTPPAPLSVASLFTPNPLSLDPPAADTDTIVVDSFEFLLTQA